MIFPKAVLTDRRSGTYDGRPYSNVTVSSETGNFKFSCEGVDMSAVPSLEPLELELEVTGKSFQGKQSLTILSFKARPFYQQGSGGEA